MACADLARGDGLEDMWGADMEQLAQILRECHLDDNEVAGSAVASGGSSAGTAPAASAPAWAGAPGTAPASPPPAAATAAAAAVVGPWADELVRRLQGCGSPEEARSLCAEALVCFHQQQASTAMNAFGAASSDSYALQTRLHKLQGANKVIIRALRSMSERQQPLQVRCRQAEEQNVLLAEELRRTREQLQAAERAKANLQSHLHLMNSNLTEAPFRDHQPGPPGPPFS